MSSIRILQKPECVSWIDLARLQQRAHENNKSLDIKMKCADLSARQLEEALKNAVTLVALDEYDTLVGMLNIEFQNVDRWWHKGRAAYICYVAIAPEFQGCGIMSLLSAKADKIIINNIVNVAYLHTHVNNVIAKKAYEKNGYMTVRFSPGSGTDYYQIEMARWLNREKRNRFICKFMSLLTELISRVIYKPGKIRRF